MGEDSPLDERGIAPGSHPESTAAAKALVTLALAAMALGCARVLTLGHGPWVEATAVSVVFAVAVRALGAATAPAAGAGALVCWLLICGSGSGSVWLSGLTPLAVLFVLTFTATRVGRRRSPAEAKEARSERHGRRLAQVLANLGVAGVVASAGPQTAVAVLAALAEAAADTVASEVGKAFGGQPRMIGSFRRVAAGTDGAMSVAGTLAGCAAAVLVTVAGWWSLRLPMAMAAAAAVAGVSGLLFDSVLGATAERRGWLTNDWVNLLSTGFAAGLAGLFQALLARR